MTTTATMFRRLLALALLGAAAAIAVALLSGGSATSAADAEGAGQSSALATPSETPAELQAQFEAAFALLRTPGGDAIPAAAPIDDPTLQLDEARQLTPPSGRALARGAAGEDPQPPDATVWVAPRADGSQCLLAYREDLDSLSGNCIYPEDAVAGRFVMTQSVTSADAAVYGLMPDGIDSVTVNLADGTSAELPVVDNAYMAQFDRPTFSLSWTDQDDVVHTLPLVSAQ